MDGDKQPSEVEGSRQFQPGESISPRTATPASQPAVVANPVAPAVPTATPQPVFQAPISTTPPTTQPSQQDAITWTASEFVAHEKNQGWYGLLGGGAVVVALLIWLVTKDVISAIVILVAAGMFGSFAARQPRELAYSLDDSGLSIGPKHYPYQGFRSFSIMQEGAITSIVFMPLKRFAPMTSIYYDPDDEEKIVDLLSVHLPLEERKHDAIDRLMWRIRF